MIVSFLFVACSNKKENLCMEKMETLSLVTDEKDHVSNEFVEFVDFLKLNEPELTFNTITKLLIHKDTIYIFDKFGVNTVMSFDMKGNYITNYGRRGKSQSEYIRLFDFDVDDNYVYLYDRMKSKMLLYSHDGKFVKDISSQFHGDGFTVLGNGNFLFSLGRDNGIEKLCLTDSSLKIQKVLLEYEKEEKADLLVSNLFQRCNDTIYYNRPLSDDVYKFSNKGESLGVYKMDFDGNNIPDEKKYSYEALIKNKDESKYTYLDECPLFVNNKMIAPITNNGDRSILYYDFEKKDGGVKSWKNKSLSINDIIAPLYVDDIYIVGRMDMALFEYIKVKDGVPDEIKSHMQEGNAMLVFYQMRK